MEEVISYLLSNPEIIQQVKDGTVSLVGVQEADVNLILNEVDGLISPNYYWR